MANTKNAQNGKVEKSAPKLTAAHPAPRKRVRVRARRRRTFAGGAVVSRDLLRKHARRMLAAPRTTDAEVVVWGSVVAWLNAQPERAKRHGGIGR